ncbi:MAG: hypothetical protein RMX96_01475 [Nostoc sp. ChiSLP02]|nr:hypothetical protein [Nostoc sp. DedSLP05]MDZ8102926.1 hypothetical protein [Nostoc sp. DedSLP01]MDZ8183518.1 hypothetical protein [Nostoc sp. ChiSLP02]
MSHTTKQANLEELISRALEKHDLHHCQPIAPHKPTTARKAHPDLPMPQIPVSYWLTISNPNSFTRLGNEFSVEPTSTF